MQPHIMTSLGSLFVLLYLVGVVAVIVFILVLLWRFVSAHERVANALENIARKLRDEGKP